jgi:thioesterase domain-containing protein
MKSGKAGLLSTFTTDRRPDYVPLSFGQRLILTRQHNAPTVRFTLPITVEITGPLDLRALEYAIADVTERHEILRTTFPEVSGKRWQYVNSFTPQVKLDISSVTQETLREKLTDAETCVMDIRSSPPFRAHLFSIAPTAHILLLLMHHIGADAWSAGPLIQDLLRSYSSRQAGEVPNWPKLPMQYGDYALWENQQVMMNDEDQSPLLRQLKFWKETLRDLPNQIVVGTGRTRSDTAIELFDTVPVRLNPALHKSIVGVAECNRVSTFMALHAALIPLLIELGVGYDVPICTLVRGRPGLLDHLVGWFANFVVLRTNASGNPSFSELLGRVRRADVNALSSQDLPFFHLAHTLESTQSISLDSLFRVLLIVRRPPEGIAEISAIRTNLRPLSFAAGGFNLTFELIERRTSAGIPEGVDGQIQYNTNVYDRSDIERIAMRFSSLLRVVVASPDQRIDQLLDETLTLPTTNVVDAALGKSDQLWNPNTPAMNVMRRVVATEVPRLYKPAGNSLQSQLVEIWEDCLGLRRIGVEDEFFDLGGTPEVAKQICERIEYVFDYWVPLALFLKGTTIEEVAEELLRQLPVTQLLEIQAGDAGSKPPVFYLHGDFAGGGLYARALARSLGADQPVFVLQQHGLNGEQVPASIEEMAEDHVRRLRRFYPRGPYYLSGHCNGGLIAFEMARRLLLQKQEVKAIILIETPFPDGKDRKARSVVSRPAAGWINSPRTSIAWIFNQYVPIVSQFKPQWYAGKVHLLSATNEYYPIDVGSITAWKKTAAEVESHSIPGDHVTCIGRYVNELGAVMKACLQDSQATKE